MMKLVFCEAMFRCKWLYYRAVTYETLLFLPIARSFITVILESNKLVGLHTSTSTCIATSISSNAGGCATTIGFVDWWLNTIDPSPLVLIIINISAHGVILHTSEGIVISLISKRRDVGWEALIKGVAIRGRITCGGSVRYRRCKEDGGVDVNVGSFHAY